MPAQRHEAGLLNGGLVTCAVRSGGQTDSAAWPLEERERERESTPDAMNTIFLKEEEKSDMIKLQKCNTVNTNSRFRFESVQ